MKSQIVVTKLRRGSTPAAAKVTLDFITDYLDPNAGVPLSIEGLEIEVQIAQNANLINGAIKTALLSSLSAQGFNTGLTAADIVMFGGAV